MAPLVWIETLGCPKNEVDSAKLSTDLARSGYTAADRPEDADLVVVNTCAFIEPARVESIETVLELSERRRPEARLVVTGCLAERSGPELAAALPEVDLVAGFGESLLEPVPVALGARRDRRDRTDSLLELPRGVTSRPWAYVKVAEGCDRRCGFCAIPSFRGPQRSRSLEAVLAEVEALAAGGEPPLREVVLIAQDLASFGRDRTASPDRDLDAFGGAGAQPLLELLGALKGRVDWVRLLYLYPTGLTPALVEAILDTGVAYFDLSLQHVSRPLLKAMRRPGEGARFLERIAGIRALAPDAAFRSSFIIGYPGETEADHDQLLEFLEAATLDWAGFFAFSPEEGTYAAALGAEVPAALVAERLAEATELQDRLTAERRDRLVGTTTTVLVDAPGVARSFREAPEIDGVVVVPDDLLPGTMVEVELVASLGTDLVGEPRLGEAR